MNRLKQRKHKHKNLLKKPTPDPYVLVKHLEFNKIFTYSSVKRSEFTSKTCVYTPLAFLWSLRMHEMQMLRTVESFFIEMITISNCNPTPS